MEIETPKVYKPIFQPKRYKVISGGRGSAKSETVARFLVALSATQKNKRILCTREYQNSITDSVYRTIKDIIDFYKLPYFEFTKVSIKHQLTNSEFIFKGLQDMNGIKSIKGITHCWVEEAQSLTQNSIDILTPTIREPNSEIIFTFNRDNEDDPVWTNFCNKERDDVWHLHTTYRDNKFFPEVLRREMEYCKINDYQKYLHVWEGDANFIKESQIFKGKFTVQDFETMSLENTYQNRYFYGADWGFANDPTTMVRCYIHDMNLYVDQEVWGVGVELDEIPQLFDAIPESRIWQIKADCSRPETISHIAHKGFNIVAAEKWSGSIEDGIEYLRSFKQIIIHPRCKHTADEFKLYSYKLDKNTNEVLPIVVDLNNHCIDSLRYALDMYIKKEVSIYDSY
jgi:phage terminase large subunit